MTSLTTLELDAGMEVLRTNGLFLDLIDNYYPNPEEVRDFALGCSFEPAFTGTWRGLQSLERHPDTQKVFEDLVKRIPAKGQHNWNQIEQSFAFWGRPSAGMFALLRESEADTVHFHIRSGTWAGVCYLVPQDIIRDSSGVGFYRHKATGRFSCLDSTDVERQMFREDGKHPERWDRVYAVPMRFNRMVIFDGRFFHAASDGFGNSPSNGRLAQLFNIDFSN